MSQHDFSARSNPTRKLLAAAVFLALSTGTAAAASAIHVDIPAQPLSASLRALATQGGAQVVFTSDAVSNKAGVAISGDMSLDEALQRLLAGTGLAFRKEGENSYVVVPATEKGAALDEVVVTATRTERNIRDVPASVSVVNSKDIARMHVVKPDELLRNIEGIDFNGSPASGSPTDIRLRGFGGGYGGQTTALLIDSMNTDSIISNVKGRGGLNFLPAQEIERIEVVRGPASALYGPNIIGGVINASAKRWHGPAGIEYFGEIGSHNSWSEGAAAGVAEDSFDIRVYATKFKTDGIISKPTPDAAGEYDLAPRDWEDAKQGMRASIRPAPNQEISISLANYLIDAATIGGRPEYRQENKGEAMAVGYRNELSGNTALALSYRKNKLKDNMRYDDEAWNGTLGSYALGGIIKEISNSETIEAQADFGIGSDNHLIFGVSHQRAFRQRETEDVAYPPATRSDYRSKMTGVYLQDEFRLSEAATVTAGGRYDRITLYGTKVDDVESYPDSTDSVFSPRVGMRYRLSPATSMYVSASTAYVPALNSQKSGGGDPNWVDNPDLKPQTSTTYEAGVNQKLDRLSIRATVYHTEFKDQIAAVSVASTTYPKQYVNIGRVDIDGVELEMTSNLAGGWQPYANYSYIDSVIRNNPTDPETEGKRSQRIAPHRLNAGLVYAPGNEFEARIGGRYVDERFFTDRNLPDRRAPSYFVADAKVSVKLAVSRPGRPWEAYVAVNNLFDKQYTEWENEYADGRNIWCGVTGRF